MPSPIPKRPEKGRSRDFGEDWHPYWVMDADEADAYMDYLEERVRLMEKLVEAFAEHGTHDDCYWCRDLRDQVSDVKPDGV